MLEETSSADALAILTREGGFNAVSGKRVVSRDVNISIFVECSPRVVSLCRYVFPSSSFSSIFQPSKYYCLNIRAQQSYNLFRASTYIHSSKRKLFRKSAKTRVSARKEVFDLSVTSMSQFNISNQEIPSTSNIYESNSLICPFYEALLVLDVFNADPDLAFSEEGMPGSEAEEDLTNLNEKQLRREFIRHLAYLCSYDQGDAPVTAIAICQTRQAELIVSSRIRYQKAHMLGNGESMCQSFLLRIVITLQLNLSSNI
jgi:hypothetical protein